MAGKKVVTNASKADAPKTKAGGAATTTPPPQAVDWVARGNQLGIDKVAAEQLDTVLIPQLREAGYSPSQIKSLFVAGDPHLAAKKFIDDEKLALMDSIGKANYGFTQDQMLGMSLKDLRETASSIKEGAKRPSRIRGKDPNASQKVESRTDGNIADAKMGDTPGEVPAVVPQPSRKKISEAKAAAAKTSEKIKSNVDKVKNTGSMAGVDWLQSNRDSMVVGRDAATGNWAGLTAEDMTGERGPVFKRQPAEATATPTPGGQAADTPPAPTQDSVAAGGKPVSNTDPLVRGASAAGPLLARSFKQAPVTSTAVASIAVPLTVMAARHGLPMAYRGMEKLYGAAFGDGTATQQQQQQKPMQGGPGPQIFILPREALRGGDPPPAVSRPTPPPMQQPPAPSQAPAGKAARPDQSTDIIRALSGRMA